MNKTLTFLSTTLCLILILGLNSNVANASAKDFLGNSHWKKGKAEWQWYNYALKWYGKARTTKNSQMILVTEPWNNGINNKTGKNIDSYVLKFSIHDIFATGTYNYAFKADMFIDQRGRVVKYVMGSQDGCGAHFMRYDESGDNGKFVWHSYWNDHGKMTKSIDADSFDTFYDALPAYLRFRLNEKSYNIKMVKSLVGNHPPGSKKWNKAKFNSNKYPKVVGASVSVSNEGDNYKVVVKHGSAKDTLTFSSAFPHTLISWNMAKGGFNKKLRKSDFFAYWVPANRGKEPTF